MASQKGFTLMEVIISMTIMSLVVTVLYSAFSTGIMTWQDQDETSADFERITVLSRLFYQDMLKLVPYTANGDNGQFFFFAGGNQTIFYSTANGLGSHDRVTGGIYFACMFFAPCDGDKPERRPVEEGESVGLFLCKMDRPWTKLMEGLQDFASSSEDARNEYVPSEEIMEKSVLLAKNLTSTGFSFSSSTQAMNQDGFEEYVEDGYVLSESNWGTLAFPKRIQLNCQALGKPLRIIAEPEQLYEDKANDS